MPQTRLTLLGKPGCHLCDDARETIAQVLERLPGVVFEERSILDDRELFDRYREEIPVVLIDDRVHAVWRVDAERLERALTSGHGVSRLGPRKR